MVEESVHNLRVRLGLSYGRRGRLGYGHLTGVILWARVKARLYMVI